MGAPLQGTDSAANAIARVKYSHDAVIDMIIADPTASQGDLAKMFGYSQTWMSRVMNSDAFLARLAERKGELVDPALTASIEEKLRTLASNSLDRMIDRLGFVTDFNTMLKTVEVSTKALGFGARQSNVAVQQNFVVALPGKAASAEEWAQAYTPGGGQAVKIVEGELVPPPDPSEKLLRMLEIGGGQNG